MRGCHDAFDSGRSRSEGHQRPSSTSIVFDVENMILSPSFPACELLPWTTAMQAIIIDASAT
jgi:hypothetical protein